MNTRYRFELIVDMPSGEQKQACFEVEALVAKECLWEPYDRCSDGLSFLAGLGVSEDGAKRIDTQREKLAQEIAGRLTAHIMAAIKSRDLRDGYRC